MAITSSSLSETLTRKARSTLGIRFGPSHTEVIVTRYEKGIAYVRRWDEMSGDRY